MPKADPHIIRTEVLAATCSGCQNPSTWPDCDRPNFPTIHLVDRRLYCPDCCPKCKKATLAQFEAHQQLHKGDSNEH